MRTDRTIRWYAGIAAAVICLSGCLPASQSGEKGRKLPQSSPSASASLPDSRVADMTRTFPTMAWMNESEKDPLRLGRLVARVAGGAWIALAPHPMDEVSWSPNYNEAYRTKITVADALERAQKTKGNIYQQTNPFSNDGKDSYHLLYFGPEKEVSTFQTMPPEIVGAYLTAPTGAELLQMAADFWHLKVDFPADLCTRRESLVTARRTEEAKEKERQTSSVFNPRYYSGSDDSQQRTLLAIGPEFQVVERISPEELLHRLADYFGSTCENSGGVWTFKPLKDSAEIKTRLDTLVQRLNENPTTTATGSGFTSFAERQSGVVPQETAEVNIPSLDDAATGTLDDISLFGVEAVPTLARLLDVHKPALALGVIGTLSRMQLPESRQALLTFTKTLETPTGSAGEKATAAYLYKDLILVLLRDAKSAEIASYLSTIVNLPKTPLASRLSIRQALAENGNVAAFTESSPSALALSADPPFTVGTEKDRAAQTTGDQSSEVVVPLATYKLPNGETWCVFLSGRYGDPNNLFLARSSAAGRWEEFLFTGQSYQPTIIEDYGYSPESDAPKPGCCVLSVDGDKVVLHPPESKERTELNRLNKIVNDSKTKEVDRQKAAQRRYQLATRVMGFLGKTITLSLAALRADSDGDGLPDAVETQLGLDPKKADTDGDSIADSTDTNPLVSRSTPLSDRAMALQSIFSACFGGDPATTPVIVVLDKEYQQEFSGIKARVFCLTPEEFEKRNASLKTFRVLQFGGPQDDENTILERDGPCLFNDTRTRAQIHFWYWYGRPSNREIAEGQGPFLQDYVARLERKGNHWDLISAKPWRYGTAMGVMASLLGQQGRY